MTFPSDKDIEFFTQPEVSEFFRARWKERGPQRGDWYLRTITYDPLAPKDTILPEGGITKLLIIISNRRAKRFNLLSREIIWLPRPDQLIEILEEKGYCPAFKKRGGAGFLKDAPPYHASASKEDDYQWAEGPTPAIALAKCVMEIEGSDDK